MLGCGGAREEEEEEEEAEEEEEEEEEEDAGTAAAATAIGGGASTWASSAAVNSVATCGAADFKPLFLFCRDRSDTMEDPDLVSSSSVWSVVDGAAFFFDPFLFLNICGVWCGLVGWVGSDVCDLGGRGGETILLFLDDG